MEHTLQFLAKLSKNNNREWFDEHKDQYLKSKEEFEQLVDQVKSAVAGHDELEKHKIFRIYRDVRFSKDKTPYSTDWRASFSRAGADRRGGYYLRVSPGDSLLIGGFFGPESKDLLHIRKQIQQDPDALRNVLNEKSFKAYFGELSGEQVKSAPKGFSKEDPAIDLLRYKQFMVRHSFSDDEVRQSDFAQQISDGFQRMRPYFDYMTDILTTDLNGMPLL